MSSFSNSPGRDKPGNLNQSAGNVVTKCEFCGKPLPPALTTGTRAKYCNASCRTQKYYASQTNRAALELLRTNPDEIINRLVAEEVEKAQAPLLDTIDHLVGEIARMRRLASEVLTDGN